MSPPSIVGQRYPQGASGWDVDDSGWSDDRKGSEHPLVNAWLDAHFDSSSDANPLTSGLCMSPPLAKPLRDTEFDTMESSTATGWDYVGNASSPHASPHKRPRLLSDVVTDTRHRQPVPNSFPPEDGDGARGICGGGRLRGGAGDHLTPVMSEQGGVWHRRYGSRSEPATPVETSDRGRDTYISERGGDTEPGDSQLDASARRFAASLTDMAMPPPKKRKSMSLSPSKASSSHTDTRHKRQALFLSQPSGTFGIPDLADHEPEDLSRIPDEVIALLGCFSTGSFETACVPQTPEIDALLAGNFPHERIPAHARLEITAQHGDGPLLALELVNFAIETHRACLRNSRAGEDEAAWYPLVRSLLSTEPPPPDSGCVIPRPPRHSYHYRWTVNDLFITIDATTKSTTADLAPTNINVKLDALVAFNREHRRCKSTIRRALTAGIKVNAFADIILAGTVVALGVEVKSTGGAGGEMEAEYQLGVWGMKTLNLMKRLAPGHATAHVMSVSVCGHAWNLHVTYWRDGEIVTHGPVGIGGTDTLYGTMKVIAFVKMFKEWARDEVWGRWEALVEAAAGGGGE